jgi:hypothetical protein
MGYTHYWHRRGSKLDPERFQQFVADCERIYRKSEIPLAGWDGTGNPVFSAKEVAFNGWRACGHDRRDLGSMWPAAEAQGGINPHAQQYGTWFAGALLSQRTCDGDCSHETFRIRQYARRQPWEPKGEALFAFCKTAYKPYDILVTGCLIIAQHYFPCQVRISSDGESKDWEDARRLCQHVLGYGAEFVLPRDDDEAEA